MQISLYTTDSIIGIGVWRWMSMELLKLSRYFQSSYSQLKCLQMTRPHIPTTNHQPIESRILIVCEHWIERTEKLHTNQICKWRKDTKIIRITPVQYRTVYTIMCWTKLVRAYIHELSTNMAKQGSISYCICAHTLPTMVATWLL